MDLKAFEYHFDMLKNVNYSFHLRNYFSILQMLTETLFKIPSSVVGRHSSVGIPHWML